MSTNIDNISLEDTFYRIQDRLFRLTDEASKHLHFAVASCKLTDGLVGQLEEYLKAYPDSRLIVIDTLQKIRTASKENAYANDYGDISLIKDFADRHALAVVVVHHIRKQKDNDVFNQVSGTTGLTGSADTNFVLEKTNRAGDTAVLYATGRDIEYQEFTLRFRDCSWELLERKGQEQLAAASVPPVLFRVAAFMQDKREWSGTATELLEQLGETDTAPTVITKLLNEYRITFLKDNNLVYDYRRIKAGRRIVLAKGAVTYGLELMMALFNIVQGLISTIMNAAGFGSATDTVLPQEIVTAVEDCGFFESIPLWAVTLIGGLFITVLSFIMIMSVYGRFFKLYLYTAIAPVPLSAFAGEPSQSVGKSFIKSYSAVCLEGAIIVLACIIFSLFAAAPPVVNPDAAAVTMVWSYVGELIFNMLILVGAVKMADRVVREMMGL